MLLFLIAIVTVSLGSGATLAQTVGGSSPSAAVSASSQSPTRAQARQLTHEGAVTDCMRMWDSGTHMTKQAWLRTCKRVETRLDTINIDAVMPNAKATPRKLVR